MASSLDILSGSAVKILLLALTAVWQVYTMGRLGSYGSHLIESRDRHDELQRALTDAQAALQNLHNSSRSCESAAQEHAAQLTDAAKERKVRSRRSCICVGWRVRMHIYKSSLAARTGARVQTGGDQRAQSMAQPDCGRA